MIIKRFLDSRKIEYVRLMLKSVEVKFKYFCDLKWVQMSSFAKNIESLTFLFEKILDKEEYKNYKTIFQKEASFNFYKIQEQFLKVFKVKYLERINLLESELEKRKVLQEIIKNENRQFGSNRMSVVRQSVNLFSSSKKFLRNLILKVIWRVEQLDPKSSQK